MTRWLLEVKLSGLKQPLMLSGSETSPRPTFETLLKAGIFDTQRGVWYPPSRILEARVSAVGGEAK